MPQATSPAPSRKGTGQFMRQGQTAGLFGQDPAVEGKGQITKPPKDLKP